MHMYEIRGNFFWIVLSGVMVLLLLYMIYAPVLGRRYRAEKIAGDKGTYIWRYVIIRFNTEIRKILLK